MWGPCMIVKAVEGEGPISAGMGWEHRDLAKMGTSPLITQAGRWRLGASSPGHQPVDSSPCHSWPSWDEPLSDLPGRESTGEIINNTVPLENSIPGNCCSALFKNLVRPSGSSGRGSSGQDILLGEGVGSPGKAVASLTLLSLAPPAASQENQAVRTEGHRVCHRGEVCRALFHQLHAQPQQTPHPAPGEPRPQPCPRRGPRCPSRPHTGALHPHSS